MRLVLDTNVVLDLFYWRDPALAELSFALATGKCLCFVNEATLSELERVLAYPEFTSGKKNTKAPEAALAAYRALAMPEGSVEKESKERVGNTTVPLPRCRDLDDQKFLELARHCNASYLVTRDRELLRLDRRSKRASTGHIADFHIDPRIGFRILTPTALLPLLSPPADWRTVG